MSVERQQSGFGFGGLGGLGAYLGHLRETLRSELCPRDNEAALTLAKMRLAQDNMRRGMRTMPVLGLICALIHSYWSPLEATMGWWVFFMAGWYFRMRAQVLPDDASNPNAVRSAAMKYAFWAVAFSLVWSSQAMVFWHHGDPVNQLTIAVIMLASASTASLVASWAPASAIQIALYLGTVAVLLMTGGTQSGLLLGLALFGYCVFVSTGLGSLHGAARRMLNLEDQKDNLIAELRASNKAKSEFLANMSHELRTPLNAIIGFSEVMKGEMFGPLGSAKYRDYAGDIHGSGGHLLSLINDILDLAKIEAGRFVPSEERVVVRRIANEAMRFVQLRADDADVHVKLAIEGNPVIQGDERALKQSLINLLSNALKFTPARGTVTLGARRTAFGATLLWVADTGCGISPEDQVKLFQSFGQGRHDVAVKEKGTGLGLAIVRGIVEAHGGTIGMDSALGRGTTVTISLPASRALKAMAEAA